MTKKDLQRICVFTSEFPYGTSEQFIEPEIRMYSGIFEEVHIFPDSWKNESTFKLPPNVHVHHLYLTQGSFGIIFLFRYFFQFIHVFLFELYHSDYRWQYLKNFLWLKSHLLQILSHAKLLEFFIRKNFSTGKTIYYSFWFSEWAIVLSLLNNRKLIPYFYSRAHGFDVYGERNILGFIPFRHFQFKGVKKVLTVSQAGCVYLKNKYPEYENKIGCKYMGVKSSGENPFRTDFIFTIVSCSYLVSLKRIHLIAEALHYCDFPLHWIHIGDGPLKNTLLPMFKDYPAHIKITFTGHITKEDVIRIYSHHPVHLFVHVSESEGLPVSIMEAESFGIPILACNVGGVPEIVTDQSGILMNPDISPEEIALEIKKFKNSEKNSLSFRKSVREYHNRFFNSDKNYPEFIRELMK